MLALCDMKTLYLRKVPDDVSEALKAMAAAESLSVSAVAVRELAAAVAFRRNVDVILAAPRLAVDYDDVVSAVREGRDR